MSALGLSGLASGVDTSSIIDQLMALERQKTQRISNRQTAVAGQQTSLTAVAGKLTALKTAALALSAPATWKQSQTVTSSDPTRVVVAQTGGAGIGGHTVQVDRLASSMQRGYSYTPAAGSLTIAYAAGDPKSITVPVAVGSTLQEIADAINAKTGGPVVAAVVKNGADQDRLVLSSRTTGSTSDFTVTSAGVLVDDPAYQTPDVLDLDALYRLDGGAAIPSKTNVVENAIPGLKFTMKAVTASAATISVSESALDTDGLKAKIKTFVAAYNAVVDTTREKLTDKPVTSPSSDFQAAFGSLYGDVGLQGMLGSLRATMTEFVAAAGINDLGDIGITVPKATGGVASADGKAGRLVLDEVKLSAALTADATAVNSFFGTFATSVETFVKAQTGGSGVIDERLKSADRNLGRLASQLLKANERLDAKEKRMKSQFAAMELALQKSQTQQAWLTGQLDSLNSSNNRN
jgi:flagellar hook-associated protein 2